MSAAIPKELADWDWEHIFDHYTNPTHVRTKTARGESYKRTDVAKVVAAEDGANDGPEWVGLFKMRDGKWLAVRAGCDYTGWGCVESGSSDYADTKADAIAFGLTEEERTRLGLRNRPSPPPGTSGGTGR